MQEVEKIYQSSCGTCNIHTVIWYPDEKEFAEPVGIIQIAHGMIDHVKRFENLAEYMTGKGFIVVGNDHLGHGESVPTAADRGYYPQKKASAYVVKDMYHLTSIMKNKYPRLPYFLLGHSMGSFLTRRYITVYGQALDGVMILGTGNHPAFVLKAGRMFAKCNQLVFGKRHVSSMINEMMFGNFNQRIDHPQTDNDWLSTDPEVAKRYESDPKCDFKFSISGCLMILDTLIYLSKKKNRKGIPTNLPILFAAGEEDPVGNYGADIDKLVAVYEKYHLQWKRISYKGCRHELHNEVDNEKVFADLYNWMIGIIKQ